MELVNKNFLQGRIIFEDKNNPKAEQTRCVTNCKDLPNTFLNIDKDEWIAECDSYHFGYFNAYVISSPGCT